GLVGGGVVLLAAVVVGVLYATGVFSSKGADSRELILGKWEVQDEKEKGGLEFRKDGSVLAYMEGAPEPLPGTYKFLDDEHIELPLSLGGETIPKKMGVKSSKDELVTPDETNKVDRFRRPTGALLARLTPPKPRQEKTTPEKSPPKKTS